MEQATTFGEVLAKLCFDGKWPMWSTPEEVEAFHSRPAAHPTGVWFYELGKQCRSGTAPSTEDVQKADVLLGVKGCLQRWQLIEGETL